MQAILKSQIKTQIYALYDYLRANYAIALEVHDEWDENENQEVATLYIDEQHPDFEPVIVPELQRFAQDPFHSRYQSASWTAETHQMPTSSSGKKWNFRVFAQVRKMKFTAFLTALCALIFLFTEFGDAEHLAEILAFPDFNQIFSETNQRVELWRYFSHTLIHLSPLHFLLNMSFWWLFGGAIERQLGAIKLIGIFVISALLSGVGQFLTLGVPAFFGLSGVVYATMGFIATAEKFGNNPAQRVLPQGFFAMGVMGILSGFAFDVIGENIGNAAHIGGFIVGLILGILQGKWSGKKVSLM